MNDDLALQEAESVETVAHQIPTDSVLQQVANKIARRDWHLVANKLGYTSDNIKTFEKENSGNPVNQVRHCLHWFPVDGQTNAGLFTGGCPVEVNIAIRPWHCKTMDKT